VFQLSKTTLLTLKPRDPSLLILATTANIILLLIIQLGAVINYPRRNVKL
jgi:hypothetical protein